MKKLTTLFVIALLVLSLAPAVFADDGSDHTDMAEEFTTQDETTDKANTNETKSDETSDKESEATSDNIRKTRQQSFDASREELKTRAEAKRTALRAKRDTARVNFMKDRAEVRSRFSTLREEYKGKQMRVKELREEFKNKREDIRTQREDARKHLVDMRGNLKECAGEESVDCKETRKNAKKHANNFLNRAAEHIIAVLEKARDRVENSDLSDEQKAAAIAEIDSALAEIAAAKDSVSELGEDATKEDLKEAAAIIREAWQTAKNSIKHGVGRVASKRIGGVIVKMDKLDDKFERVITRLKEAGKDTSAAEAKLADFDAKLDSAEALHKEAQTLFESGDKPGAAAKIREAHAQLKDAHVILKDLVQEIRKIGGSEDLEKESDEAEDEADDEDEAEDDEEDEE